jgi:hypothetical protein
MKEILDSIKNKFTVRINNEIEIDFNKENSKINEGKYFCSLT